ncbi:MAG: cysteine desulfurase family protein [Rhodospirillales bacterium]|nr:cysteine desulfurase family protein [Rhodospirillales bacterium]
MKIGKAIYLDHQATTPMDRCVLAEMIPYYSDSFGNPHSSDHAFGWESARAVEEAGQKIARMIGADPDEITFTSGATESNNMALLGLGRRGAGGERRRILVSAVEHKCVLAAARVLQEQYGYTIEQIPVSQKGFVEASVLEEAMEEDVLAVSVMAVNNEIGTIQDIREISECVHRYGAVFHCDAAQAPLTVSMNALASQADILSLSGHKMYGPKGIGIIFIARGLENRVEPLIYGGGQQGGLRSGTVPVALCVGLGAAAEMLSGQDADRKRNMLRHRRDAFVKSLKELPWPISVNGPEGKARHSGNANIRFSGFSAHDILNMLQPHLSASSGSACTSGNPETSHVLKAIGLDGNEAESSVRFSLGFTTSEDDIEEAVGLIDGVLTKLSKVDISGTA